ncbi:MAG: hypothetical protein CME66_00815 [Halobacteriovoraceae bacterium]|jgi:regulatory protein|nr:hypothetical protein [Halobacteriovoraceae bacterium]|tara:strand:+ start:431 stop:997 length:567 start_codon:yes stop_codon:yes gene_type:complete
MHNSKKIQNMFETYEEIKHTQKDLDHNQDNAKDPHAKKAFDYAIRILSLRDYSIYKMKKKLQERKFSEDIIEKTIQKLLDYNYLREEEFTRIRIKQFLVKGYANSYIKQKLMQEHLNADDQTIDQIRDEQNLGHNKQLYYLIEKKLRYKEIPTEFIPKQKLRNKLCSFLATKGYNYSEINTALNEFIN